jgi:hypothetical protein
VPTRVGCGKFVATGGQVLWKRVNGQSLRVEDPQMMAQDALVDMLPVSPAWS